MVGKVGMMERGKGEVWVMRGMRDLWDWKGEWNGEILRGMKRNGEEGYILVRKCGEKMSLCRDEENVWMGVRVRGNWEKKGVEDLKRNMKGKE